MFSQLCYSVWEVDGGVDGVTCADHTANDTVFDVALNNNRSRLTCQNLHVPDCADRTVYCTFPPQSIAYGSNSGEHRNGIAIMENPSPNYAKKGGKIFSKFITILLLLFKCSMCKIIPPTISVSLIYMHRWLLSLWSLVQQRHKSKWKRRSRVHHWNSKEGRI